MGCLSAVSEEDMRRIVADYEVFYSEFEKDVNVLTSALMDDCIEKARPFNADGAHYYGLSMTFNGVSNVADSLSVLSDLVLNRKLFAMEQLLEAMNANWEGHEALRTQILRQGHFFGNDDPMADALAQRIVLSIDSIKKRIQSPAMNTFVCGSFVGATHPNIILGKKMPASPDGRFAAEELAMGVSQTGGKDKNGVTALLKSISSLDYSKFCGCLVSNLKLSPQMADTPEKRRAHCADVPCVPHARRHAASDQLCFRRGAAEGADHARGIRKSDGARYRLFRLFHAVRSGSSE